MAAKTIPNLDAVTTPASTDEFGVRQSGDTEDKKQTRAQLHTLETAEQFLADDGTALLPGIANKDRPDDGFRFSSNGVIEVSLNGAAEVLFNTNGVGGVANNAGQIFNETASATNPTIVPNRNDGDTGLGSPVAGDDLSVVVGAVEAVRYTEATGILQAFESDVGLTAATDSVQGAGVILSSFNVYDTVATAGDAATLPATFLSGPSTIVCVKNGAATNSMDVFPAAGDDAGGGADTAVAIAAGDFKVFLGTTASATWEQIMGGTA